MRTGEAELLELLCQYDYQKVLEGLRQPQDKPVLHK